MDERLAANLAYWEERVAIHAASPFYDVEGWLGEGRGPRALEREALGDVTGLRLVHLQCHFGLDTLAWARVGAVVTGLDFAPSAVELARNIAERAGLADRASFVCADVHDSVEALDHRTFDVVYVSLGALCWVPSVERWADVAMRLLVPGGRLFVHDGHPLAWAMAEDEPTITASYFEEKEPFTYDGGTTYADAAARLAGTRTYDWNHRLGEIAAALLGRGLVLEAIDEHDWTLFQPFSWLVQDDGGRWTTPPGRPRVPLSFSLLGHHP